VSMQARWDQVKELLREAHDLLPEASTARLPAPVSDGPVQGTLNEYVEFLEHNELELAWDALAAVAQRDGAPAAAGASWPRRRPSPKLSPLTVAALLQAVPAN